LLLLKLKTSEPNLTIGVSLLLDLPDSETTDIKLMLAMLTKSSRRLVFQKTKSFISTMMMLLTPVINMPTSKVNFSTSQPRLELKVLMFMLIAKLTSEEMTLPLRTSSP
jgi:hypothetical protein